MSIGKSYIERKYQSTFALTFNLRLFGLVSLDWQAVRMTRSSAKLTIAIFLDAPTSYVLALANFYIL